MKKVTLFIVLLVSFSQFVFAQQPGNNKSQVEEKIEAQRIAFITARLDLSPQEAQNFWPIYNEYKKQEKALRKSIIRPGQLASASDSEIESYLDESLEIEAQQLKLKRQYYQKLKGTISVRKIANLIIAERAFTQMVLKRMNVRSENRRRKN